VKPEFVYSQEMLVWAVQTGCARVGCLLVLMLTAIVLHKMLTSGRNRPAVFGCVDQDGNPAGEFVVKLSGAMETRDRGPASELIASFLAGHFGILRPEPAAVELHPDLLVWLSKQKPELAQVLRRSAGANFGSAFLTDVSNWPVGKSLPDGMLPAAVSIFAFDCLISNDDRRRGNSNVLVRGDDIVVIDHEAAFSFLYLVSARNRSWEVGHLNAVRNHVFFYQLRRQPLDLGNFIARLAALSDGKLESIIRDVPGQWYHSDLGRISEHLRSIRHHAGEFEREMLEALA
jgi:HipA-like kinase